MIQSLYQEVVVWGEEFVSVRLTPEAYAPRASARPPRGGHGSRPSDVGRPATGSNMALARPTGFDRADAIDIRIPIEGVHIAFMAEGA